MARKKSKKTTTIKYTYRAGEDLGKMAEKITGHRYLLYRLLEKNGLTTYTLKDGDILRWE